MSIRLPRLAILPAVLLLTASFGGVPARAGERGPDVAVRTGRSPWVGRDVVNGSGAGQHLSAGVRPGRTREVLIEIRDLGPRATFVATGTPSTGGFDVAYVDGHHVDTTTGWTGDGDTVHLGDGARVFFHLRVTADRGLDTGASIDVWLRVHGVRSGVDDTVEVTIAVAPLTVSRTSRNGLRCSMTYPSRALEVGSFTGIAARLTNVGPHAVRAFPGPATLTIRNGAGRVLDRTGFGPLFFSEPPPFPVSLAPGRSVSLFVYDARIRWPGPLNIRALCGYRMPRPRAVTLDVSSAGPPASVQDAIDRAVGVRNGPFRSCHPGPAGEPTTGQIAPPDGRDIPPLRVRCWATVSVHNGFDRVKLHMVSPDDAPAYVLNDRFQVSPRPPRHGPNYFIATWDFVVTADTAHPYLTLSESQALGSGPGVYGYDLRHGTWTQGDWSICGSSSFTYWFTGSGFSLDFIAGCHRGSGASPSAERSATRTTTTGPGWIRSVRRA